MLLPAWIKRVQIEQKGGILQPVRNIICRFQSLALEGNTSQMTYPDWGARETNRPEIYEDIDLYSDQQATAALLTCWPESQEGAEEVHKSLAKVENNPARDPCNARVATQSDDHARDTVVCTLPAHGPAPTPSQYYSDFS